MLAVGTGFTQLFRGIGQVSGVAVSSAVFQTLLDRELHIRITGEGADEVRLNITPGALASLALLATLVLKSR